MCPMNPRLLRPTPTGFDPRRIAGLQLWLDGSDSSTFTLNGSTVSEWRDKSGNSRHFAQATAAQQPVAASNVKNGRGAVAFTNDWMTGTYTYTFGSFFIVWNQPTTVSGDANPSVFSARKSSADKVANGSLGLGLAVGPTTIAADKLTHVTVSPSEPGSYRLNGVDGGSALTPTVFADGGVAPRTSPDRWQYLSAVLTTPVTGSKPVVLGADSFTVSGRLMQNGHIGEILIYDTALSASQVTRVTNYLIARWGLQ
jgi:hypothetical protein